jgi:hypothetical protein
VSAASADTPTATTTAVSKSAITTPGTAKEIASTPAPSNRNDPIPSVNTATGNANRRISGHTTALSSPNSSAHTIGCHQPAIEKPWSHRSSSRSAPADSTHTSSTRAATRPPRSSRPAP